ncbi:D-alanyl-D-alanine carboxypeptidase [Streptomyces sp. B-S-A8]|uniref:D-alanyl-D-alanine carboxypeptidase n=1 Tax=Streptomyces solicavernae TaxID=3043614 RepID=A0ABT6RL08_9ACTN|nr:serine hydrolase [Streptomyces sp. B-S-A8]MDI3385115.1 D-alanyl-D-alanine carboxypeptidase [Streptomyces sp. B-S-A8]
MTFPALARVVLAGALASVLGAPLLTPAPAPAAQAPAAAAGPRQEPTPPRPAPAAPPGWLYRSGTQVRAQPAAPALPGDISALSWLVADADSGDVLAAKNAHEPLPPASTLKTLFALTVLPQVPGTVRHTVTDAELEGIGEGSSLVGVDAGRTYRAADLWRGVFLSSGNDAVHVLAEMNGGWAATARAMQAKARSLGAHDTHVVSPDGYDAPGQVSSAYDLAVFGRAGLQHPEFRRYCSTALATFPEGEWSYDIQNTNRLLTGADGVAPYRGLLGVKNGYTSGAGHTLIAAAKHGDRTLVVTVMNPQDGGAFEVYEEARSLLDWGFAADGHVHPVGSLKPPAPKAQAGPGPAAAPTAAADDDGETWPTAGGAATGLAVVVLAGWAAYAVRRRRVRREVVRGEG